MFRKVFCNCKGTEQLQENILIIYHNNSINPSDMSNFFTDNVPFLLITVSELSYCFIRTYENIHFSYKDKIIYWGYAAYEIQMV